MVAETSLPSSSTETASQEEMQSSESPPSSLIDQPFKSLCIPIRSFTTKSSDRNCVEIFPEELPSVSAPVLTTLLKDEDAPLSLWTESALLYMTHKRERESTAILSTAYRDLIERGNLGTDEEKVRVLAAAGIAHLTQAAKSGGGGAVGGTSTSASSVVQTGVNDSINPEGLHPPSSVPPSSRSDPTSSSAVPSDGHHDDDDHHDPTSTAINGTSTTPQQHAVSDQNAEQRTMADDLFTRASQIDQLFPMTWIGQGMLNLALSEVGRAKTYFNNALSACGKILPALLGMAVVHYRERDYKSCAKLYEEAIRSFPEHQSGAGARVGLGMACYRMGQVDRAKACFRRALDLDGECVEAMVGMAVLNMASLDEDYSKDYGERMDRVVRLVAMANVADHSNAMVQNHLGNYVFGQYTQVTGVTVKVERGSCLVKGNAAVNLDAGDRIKIGGAFKTSVIEEDEDEDDPMTFRIRDPWKGPSQEGFKLYKKDYDRVLALAKGALSSTSIPEIQAESLLLLARVHHARDDMHAAQKYYERSTRLAPNLTLARFGLAQTLIWFESHSAAVGNLKKVLKACPRATDAHATLGLLEVRSESGGRKERRKGSGSSSGDVVVDGFFHLRKAIDLDIGNPDLVLLDALALQQRESKYPASLQKYRKAVQLMEESGEDVSWEILTNMGVLCHETKKYEEAAVNYEKALEALELNAGGISDTSTGLKDSTLDGEEDFIRHDANRLFWNYVDSGLLGSLVESDVGGDGLTWQVKGLTKQVKVGDHVRLGEKLFYSQVSSVKNGQIKLRQKYIPPKEEADSDTQMVQETERLFVKRANQRLANPSAVSVAFNLARLHEAAGRTIAAVELHKAIVKRHPSYVNSYLRLACIARDCGSLADCSEWLTSAYAVTPGNSEVLCLMGNLHLSLCDWQHAQSIFDQLLQQKVPKVEAYSMLCLGNIYFNNIKSSKKYNKHLKYAADWYKRILNRDTANAYAANGLGTVLAEKGEISKAKEIFTRVREVSGDAIPDALLNLGHIYLALSKHPEALQMYHNYMNRTQNNGAPITCKSLDEDDAAVLLYIAFAYFDWARQTETFNDIRAAPADGRYKKCIEFIERAMKKSKKENIVLRYNWCMAKLQAAHCVLQKLTRGIRRTAQEVKDALDGLQKSLPKVKMMIQWKEEDKKVPIAKSTLQNFVGNCMKIIENAESHLNQELKKEAEAKDLYELQRIETETKQKEKQLMELKRKEEEDRVQKELDEKARKNQMKVMALQAGWVQRKKEEIEIKKKREPIDKPEAIVDEDVNKPLFDDSSDEEVDEGGASKDESKSGDAVVEDELATTADPKATEKDLFGDDSDDDDDKSQSEDKDEKSTLAVPVEETPIETEKNLFGEDSDESESDEELVPSSKRTSDDLGAIDKKETIHPKKKRRVTSDESE